MADKTKWKRSFFSEVEPISMLDPLGSILGAIGEGEPFVYGYDDVVLMSGHSCPTVAGAFMVTAVALKALYQDDIPVRGDVRVLCKGQPEELGYGPMSQVITFITGASGDTGFKGLGGQYSRNKKLLFSTDSEYNTFIFQRIDNLKTVKVVYDPGVLPPDDELSALAPLNIQGRASDEEKARFGELWQERVRKILLEPYKNPGLLIVKTLEDFEFPEE